MWILIAVVGLILVIGGAIAFLEYRRREEDRALWLDRPVKRRSPRTSSPRPSDDAMAKEFVELFTNYVLQQKASGRYSGAESATNEAGEVLMKKYGLSELDAVAIIKLAMKYMPVD